MEAKGAILRRVINRINGIFRRSDGDSRAIARPLRNAINRVRRLWGRSIVGTYHTAQTFDRQDWWYQWRIGKTEEHCADCLHLDGQIHQASTWRAAQIQPQSPDLECNGYNCDCRFVRMPDSYNGGDVGTI